MTALISKKRAERLNDYTTRLVISKEIAKTRVFSEWFVAIEKLGVQHFE